MTPLGAAAVAVIAVAVIAVLGFLLVRSVPVQAALRFHRMGRLEPRQLPAYLNRAMARLTTPRGQAVLHRLGRHLDAAHDDPRSSLGEIVNATAPLLGLLAAKGGRVDPAVCREMATVLDARVAAFEKLEAEMPVGSQLDNFHDQAGPVALQDKLFAGLLRAESPVHLAALRDQLEVIEKIVRRAPASPFVNPDFLEDLRGILDALAPLRRLPSAEDQVLFLGQALNRILEIQEQLVILTAAQPTFGLVVGNVVMESLRQVLATALRDLAQRAELTLELSSKVLAAHRETVVVLEIGNTGQGWARNITVELRAHSDALRVISSRRSLKSLSRHQSARLEFLVEPLRSERVRLGFLLTWDDQAHRGYRRELADVVESRKAPQPATFRPLHPNPFVVGRPLLDSDVFIGREEIFERLRSSLRGASQDNVVVIIGQRRMGKTSILRRLHRFLPEDYVPVLVDLQGYFGKGEPAFFRELAATVRDGLEERGIGLPELDPEDFSLDPGRFFRRGFLQPVRRALGERRLLLLFDEFEVLEERIAAGELEPQILPYFRSLMQHEGQISFIFAGTHRLDELTGDYWGVLFNLAIYLDVGHLSHGEVERLVTLPTAPYFELDPLALTKICHFTGGHPHFSQLLAREMVELRNRERLAYLTVQDINAVANSVARRGQLHFRYLWDEAARDERLLLLALRDLLEREGLATVSAAHRFLVEHRVEPGDLPEAARRLVRRGILKEQGGQLSFAMELLRLWMDCHRNLESFLLSEKPGRLTETGAARFLGEES